MAVRAAPVQRNVARNGHGSGNDSTERPRTVLVVNSDRAAEGLTTVGLLYSAAANGARYRGSHSFL